MDYSQRRKQQAQQTEQAILRATIDLSRQRPFDKVSVREICQQAYACRQSDPVQSERILRDGLKKYPGNDVILNNLLYTMRAPERGEEMVTICKTLIEGTHDDAVKYDALRILAQTYHDMDQQDLVAPTLEQIPELYFTKLECMALLLEGETAFKAARQHMGLCLEQLVEMLLIMERQAQGEGKDQYRRLAQQVLELFEQELRPGGELVREIREEVLGGAQT